MFLCVNNCQWTIDSFSWNFNFVQEILFQFTRYSKANSDEQCNRCGFLFDLSALCGKYKSAGRFVDASEWLRLFRNGRIVKANNRSRRAHKWYFRWILCVEQRVSWAMVRPLTLVDHRSTSIFVHFSTVKPYFTVGISIRLSRPKSALNTKIVGRK